MPEVVLQVVLLEECKTLTFIQEAPQNTAHWFHQSYFFRENLQGIP